MTNPAYKLITDKELKPLIRFWVINFIKQHSTTDAIEPQQLARLCKEYFDLLDCSSVVLEMELKEREKGE